MSKVNEWLEERGYKAKNYYDRTSIDIIKGDKVIATLSGSELSVNNTPEKTIEILKDKLGEK